MRPFAKAYNITMNPDDNSAEINMYGEVVSTRPTDFWTGEPIAGDFIAQDEFLNDLELLSTKSKVTLHINSVGGDVFAGLAIYNRLRGLVESGVEVITENDALAASAGSIILQAGSKRRCRSASQTMVHGVSTLLSGYYGIKDVRTIENQLDSINKTVAQVYADRGGMSYETAKSYMSKDNWMTGKEAVDAGFADEIVEGNVPAISMAADKRVMNVGGVRIAACWMPTALPDDIDIVDEIQAAHSSPEVESKPALSVGNNTTGGNDPMIQTVDELRAAYPDLTAQIENAAREEGVTRGATSERGRLSAIEAIRASVPAEMAREAMYGENRITAEQLALQALQANAALGQSVLANMTADANDAAKVIPTPAAEPVVDTSERELNTDLEAIKNVINI